VGVSSKAGDALLEQRGLVPGLQDGTVGLGTITPMWT
jgi:hypothetical protein